MTETTASGFNGPTSPSWARLQSTRQSWFGSTGRVVLILAIAIGAYLIGRHWRTEEIMSLNNKIRSYVKDNADLTARNNARNGDLETLQNQLAGAQKELAEIRRPIRTFEIKANELKSVSIDQLTIGLIGTPRSESVDLNINGGQQTKAAGDVVTVSTTCRIEVTSFNIVNSSAVFNTTCARQ